MKGTGSLGFASWLEAQTRLATAWAETARRLSAPPAQAPAGGVPSGAPLADAWEGYLRWYGEAMRAALGQRWSAGTGAPGEGAAGQVSEAWTKELEELRAAWAELLGRARQGACVPPEVQDPGGFPAALMGAVHAQLAKLCGTPAFGFTREFQAKAAGLVSAWLEFGQTQTEYLSELRKAAASALDRFRQKLAEKKEKGDVVENPTELLELWSEAAEEGYFPVACDANFAGAQARMTNSAMRCLQSSRSLAEDFHRAVGAPTRSDIDDAFLRIHEMKRQLRALRREVGQLRRELAEARPQSRGAPGTDEGETTPP